VKEISEMKSIRINRDLWAKLQKVVADYDFTVQDLVEWILSSVDLDEYAKELASKIKLEVETEIETEKEAEEEETSTDEEDVESADDEAENFGKY
jgi:predicted DNA-binding ribbon-helix-helix protein